MRMRIKKPAFPSTSQLIWGALTAALLICAVWLVSPFIKIEAADFLRAGNWSGSSSQRLESPALFRAFRSP